MRSVARGVDRAAPRHEQQTHHETDHREDTGTDGPDAGVMRRG
jgi:hypothetical protein